jgi:hypothetical protein
VSNGSPASKSAARHVFTRNAERRRWAALMVVCLARLMIVLDVTIVNVALPAVQPPSCSPSSASPYFWLRRGGA